jgi:endo-1,4-beta-mannosidase
VMPTLYMGHMSGVNWIPGWALGHESGDARFRVVSRGRVVPSRLGNWYTDGSIVQAQSVLAHEVAGAVSGHQALWAWDLGNESSNCCMPPDKAHARQWLWRITDAIRSADPRVLVTIGLHAEDLEHDRHLGPHEAAGVCDFLTMHGYPGYAAWSAGPTDEQVLPFLARLTRWLSGGADVLFAEFGVPTTRDGGPGREQALGPELVDEQAAASYVGRALSALFAGGSTGAMLWCYADYAENLWGRPPLDHAVHERSFGLWRADGTPKPALARVRAFAARGLRATSVPGTDDATWIDIDVVDFYHAPELQVPRLYRRYCQALNAVAGSGPGPVTGQQ